MLEKCLNLSCKIQGNFILEHYLEDSLCLKVGRDDLIIFILEVIVLDIILQVPMGVEVPFGLIGVLHHQVA